jgi:hypothetical protein
MGHKLTIHQNKNIQNTYWFNSQKYSAEIINNIIDPAGGNINKLLAAIPSPFARMHMFETAFEMALRNINENQNSVFEKLVSECFDMFELVYNLKIHREAGNKITIRLWDYIQHNTKNLCNSADPAHEQLGNVLRKYVVNNKKLNSNPNIYIFYFNEKVFGGTSPFTGFFTKPNLTNFCMKRTDNNPYFSTITPLWGRDPNFILAMYKTFSTQNGQIAREASSVFKYLNSNAVLNKIMNGTLHSQVFNIIHKTADSSIPNFNSLRDDQGNVISIYNSQIFIQSDANEEEISKSPLTLQTNKNLQKSGYQIPLVLRDGEDHFGMKNLGIKVPKSAGPIGDINNRILPSNGIKYPYLVVEDFLEDNLIELRFPVNDRNFIVPNFIGIDRDKDNGFLLPIKKEYFDYCTEDDLQNNLTIRRLHGGYQVELSVPTKGNTFVTFKKQYYDNPIDNEVGKLFKIDIYMAFLPLFKMIEGGEMFNNLYTIMLVDAVFSIKKDVELKIFDDKNFEILLNTNAEKQVTKGIRNIKTVTESSSVYYSTNFPFQFIEVDIPKDNVSSTLIKGLIVPKWRLIPIGDREFDIAVDFGTTNTNVSMLEYRGGSITQPQPLTIGTTDLQTILLNKSKHDPNLTITEQYERCESGVEDHLITKVVREFLPSIIGESISRPKYCFPMRTVVARPMQQKNNDLNLFENINISFAYEKIPSADYIDIESNLKWEIGNPNISAMVKKYINEIMFLIRNKILLAGGNPSKCHVIIFKPLSMYLYDQEKLGTIWSDTLCDIFKVTELSKSLTQLTESCAPFFYYKDQNKTTSKHPVLSMDIGGGSTDVSYFINESPVFGTSFNFAGNAIWHPGLSSRKQELIGLYAHYGKSFIDSFIAKTSVKQKDQLKAIFDTHFSYYKGGLQSENLFNLFFTWDHILGFTEVLREDSNIKFLILMHFSSIIYYCAMLLKEKGYEKPQYICISGNGSKYLTILDSTIELKSINIYINNFLSIVMDDASTYKVIIQQVGHKKEATSIGGLYLLSDSRKYNSPLKDTPGTIPYYGESKPTFESIRYNQIDDPFKLRVVENVNRFLDIFFKMDNILSFRNNFGISLPKSIVEYQQFLHQNTLEYLEKGLMHRLESTKKTDQINEPLFFYPIILMLFELGKELYDSKDENN